MSCVAERDQRLRLVAHRRLEAGEGEMRLRPPEHRPRQGEAVRPAGARRLLHRRPAGKAEAQQLGGLVEGLAQRIVDGGAEPLVAADVVHDQQLRVAAGDQQQQVGRLQALGEPHRQRVRLQMVDGDQRQPVHQRQRLGRGDAHQQPADQPRPRRHRHAIELAEADPRLAHGLGDDLVEAFHVGAGGDLRHHAAVAAVLLPLRPHDVGQDAPASRPPRAPPPPRPSRRSSSRCRARALRALLGGCIHVGVVCTSARTGA